MMPWHKTSHRGERLGDLFNFLAQNKDTLIFLRRSADHILRKCAAGWRAAGAAIQPRQFLTDFVDIGHHAQGFAHIVGKLEHGRKFQIILPLHTRGNPLFQMVLRNGEIPAQPL